jgi:uncharacterized protein YbaR (Trm112 family)
MPINKNLLKILVCPQCLNSVRYDENLNAMVCDHCKLLYDIKDNIPVMLREEAKPYIKPV